MRKYGDRKVCDHWSAYTLLLSSLILSPWFIFTKILASCLNEESPANPCTLSNFGLLVESWSCLFSGCLPQVTSCSSQVCEWFWALLEMVSVALSQQRGHPNFPCDKCLPLFSLEPSHLWCPPGSSLDICFRPLLPVLGGKPGILISKGMLFIEGRVPLWLSYTILSISGNEICMKDENKWVKWSAFSPLWIISFSLIDWQICRFRESWHFWEEVSPK